MRVISGKARGHKLIAPAGLNTRPTGDRMKEDLFNILGGAALKGANFLDLYCGSGAIGIEALSRGANSATFVDESKEAMAATATNLRKTKLYEHAKLLQMPVETAFDVLGMVKFNIIFADPPYKDAEIPNILHLLDKNGILILECPSDFKIQEPTGLNIYRQKKYKQMQFIFWEQI